MITCHKNLLVPRIAEQMPHQLRAKVASGAAKIKRRTLLKSSRKRCFRSPRATQHEVLLRRTGAAPSAAVCDYPGSAEQRCTLRRFRDK